MQSARLWTIALAVLAGSGWPGEAFAWGHLARLREPDGTAHIVFAALQRARIGYCTDAGTTEFSRSDLDIQTASAIDIWLSAVADLLPAPVVVERDCDPATVDVEIVLSPIEERPTSLGRHLVVALGDRKVSKIWINSEPVHEIPLTRTSIFDLAPAAIDAEAKAAFLERLRIGDKSVHDLAADLKIDSTAPITASVYQTLIHEMGHSFGLCDVEPGVFDDACDVRWRSVPAPLAVMSIAGAINLTGDDRAGIRKLFERFAVRPSANSGPIENDAPATDTAGTANVGNVPGLGLGVEDDIFPDF